MLRFGIAGVLLLLAACATATVTSNKATSYNGTVRRLLIDANFGTAGGIGHEAEQFKSDVMDALGKCGTEVHIHEKNALSLNNNEVNDLIRQYHADSVLELAWQSVTTNRGSAIGAVYLLTLYDLKSRQAVWKAQVTLQQDLIAKGMGDKFASATIGQMKKDGLIDSACPTPGT